MQRTNPRTIKKIAIVSGLVLCIILGLFIYKNSQFHIIKIDPKLAAVSYQSPSIKIYFNDQLNPASLKVTDYGGILSKSSVSGKIVTLTFARTLKAGKYYSVTLNSVTNTGGTSITNQAINFTAQNINVNQLSKDQQKAIVAQQDQIPYSVYAINFANFSTLTDQGVSSGQLNSIETALYDYSQQVNQKFWTITLDASSLNVVLHDPANQDPTGSSATFNVTMGGQTYRVRAEYTDLDDTAYTRIYTAAGAQVFDSSN